MKRIVDFKIGLIGICFILSSCEDFLEVEAPDHKIVSETVFMDDQTAISTMTGIYNELFRAAFSGGWENSITVLAGLSSDNLKTIRENDLSLREFSENNIQPNNNRNLSLWSSAYNIIYMTNSLLEGIENSESISVNIKNSLEGEAKFIRAFSYFYLTNLFGEVPLVLSTDYRANSLSSQTQTDLIYEQILSDLNDAINLLDEEYRNGERTRANRYAATALMARVNLYLENWPEAERFSSIVIAQNGPYEILEDLNEVFLANSQEAIWQISPLGRGGSLPYTNEGLVFLFDPFFPSLTKFALSDELINSFEEGDLRYINWVGFHDGSGNYYSNKLKVGISVGEITEYSMVLRLTEQYLIRAEALAMEGNLTAAISDLNIIRERANLPLLTETNPGIDQEGLLKIILEERQKELFTEWGHRWLDLKRKGKAGEILSSYNPNWENTDALYPIPAQERMKNPNLNQNQGY